MRVQPYHPTCLKTPVSIYKHAWESENDWLTNNNYWFQQLIINFYPQSPDVMYVLLFNEHWEIELAVEGDWLNICKGQKDLRQKQSLKQTRLEERTKIHGGRIFFYRSWPWRCFGSMILIVQTWCLTFWPVCGCNSLGTIFMKCVVWCLAMRWIFV